MRKKADRLPQALAADVYVEAFITPSPWLCAAKVVLLDTGVAGQS
jgi:hypothetical protein